jgi:hypothetical protein
MADPTQPSAVDMSDGTILQSAFGPQAASESLALLNLHQAAITDQAKRQVLATLQHVLWTLRQDAGAYVDSVGWSVVQTAATHADAEVARSAQSVLAIAAQQAQGALQEEVNKIMTLIQNTDRNTFDAVQTIRNNQLSSDVAARQYIDATFTSLQQQTGFELARINNQLSAMYNEFLARQDAAKFEQQTQLMQATTDAKRHSDQALSELRTGTAHLASITHDASRQHTDQVAADLAHQLAEVTASIDLERHAAKLALASLSEKYRDLLVTVRSLQKQYQVSEHEHSEFHVQIEGLLHQIQELQASVSNIRSKPLSVPVPPHDARFENIESRFAEIQAELAQIRAISKAAPASQPRSEHFALINSRMESIEHSVQNLHDTLTEDFRLAVETVRTQLRTEFRGDLDAIRRQNPSSLPTADSSLAKQIALGEARIKQLETGRDQDLEAIGAKLAALRVENDTLKSTLNELTSTVQKLAASARNRSSTHHVVSLDAAENVAPVVEDLDVDIATEDSSSLKSTGRASVPADVILQRMYDKFDKPKYSPHDAWFVHPTAGSMIPVADQLMNFLALPSAPVAFDTAFARFVAYGGPLHIGAHTWHNKYHTCGEEIERVRAQLVEFLSTDLKTVRTVVRLAKDVWNLRFLVGAVNGAFAFDDANREHFETKWNDWCTERAQRVSKIMTDHPHEREPLLTPTNACWLAAIKGAHKPTSHKPGAKKAAAKRAAKASKDSSKHAKDSKGKNETDTE